MESWTIYSARATGQISVYQKEKKRLALKYIDATSSPWSTRSPRWLSWISLKTPLIESPTLEMDDASDGCERHLIICGFAMIRGLFVNNLFCHMFFINLVQLKVLYERVLRATNEY
jgi:hypothetical protein